MASRSSDALLLVVTLVPIWACALAIDPGSATGCYVHNAMRLMAVKDGCRPQELVVNGCWGRCDTNEVPALDPPFVSANHPLCTITSIVEKHVKLPDCDPGVDPSYAYMNAVRCGCAHVDSATTKYSYRPDHFATRD